MTRQAKKPTSKPAHANTVRPIKLTANDAGILGVLLTGASRLEAIAAMLGATTTATRDRLAQVKRKNFAQTIRGGKTWAITPEGVAVLERAERTTAPDAPASAGLGQNASSDPAALRPVAHANLQALRAAWPGLESLEGWAALMRVLPIAEFRAALRLVLAVALLRNRAPRLGPMPWVGLYGPTGTGKSTVAMCARAIVGGHFFQVGTMTTGEAVGRRSTKPPYAVESLPRTIAGPVTDLDELAEARPDVRAALYALMQRTDHLVTIEGQDLENRAVIVATWNPDGQTVPLPPGALRRGLLLDTAPYAKRLERAFSLEMIGTELRAVLERHPEPWIVLEHLPAPQPVSGDLLSEANKTLFGILTAPSDLPLPVLAGIAAAYKVLFRLEDASALAEAVSDFAAVTATRAGLMKPDWREPVTAYRARANLTQVLETTTPEDATVSPAALVRAELELTGLRANTVTRARNAREPLRKHWNHLEPGERELAAPVLATLERIGQGAPHADPDRLEALRVELDHLELEAVRVAGIVANRVRTQQRAALEVQTQARQVLEAVKAERQTQRDRAKMLRSDAKRLRDAVAWKDSTPDSKRAKDRTAIIQGCYKVGWLRSEQPRVVEPPPAVGFLANVGRAVRVAADNITRGQWITVDGSSGARVFDLNAWMLERAQRLEAQAGVLERGVVAALPASGKARALPAPKPGGGLLEIEIWKS